MTMFYSVMLSCKLAQGTQEAFVRDVKAAPDPQSILFFDWQLEDMERFLTQNKNFGILTADPTYNLGQFYVTPTTFPHLMLEDTCSKKHPLILGPVLVHQRMDFATFNYFGSSLVGFNKCLRNIRAFGTDGQEALIEAFSHSFPSALQLRCFIHFKKNILEKLAQYGISGQIADEFVADIFGKRSGSTYYEGLVDSASEEEFSERLNNCMHTWNARETKHTCSEAPKFYDYFMRYKVQAVCFCMRKDIRQKAGLGFPPSIFTTNSSESINSVLKLKVNFKESEWPEFNDKVRVLVKQQREEVIRALSSRGQYRLLPEYSHYTVSAVEWGKMRPEQRRQIIARFDKATLKSRLSVPQLCNQKDVNKEKHLSIRVEDSNISKLTLATLQFMWDKAEKLLATKNAITPAPGDDISAKMVLSTSSQMPHLVKKEFGGRYICDSRCLNWSSSGVCSHSLAVAEMDNNLSDFLSWYNSSNAQPNITSLAMTGLPSGRGRKGGVPHRTKSHNPAVSPEVSVPRPVFEKQGSTGSHIPVTPSTNACNILASACVSVHQSVTPQLPTTSSSNPPITIVCTPPQLSTSSMPILPPNINPFYVKFIQGNIRMCQGCKTTVRLSDSSIPPPPFDLVVARSERRQFRDKNGTLVTPRQEQTCHYHLRLDCIIAAEPNFITHSLRIIPLLTVIHQEYLRLMFKVTISQDIFSQAQNI